MKHATPATLAALRPLLVELRSLPGLVERTPGAFYLRSKAFLHFHEDASGLYADVKLDAAPSDEAGAGPLPSGRATHFTRCCISSPQEQDELLQRVRQCLARHTP